MNIIIFIHEVKAHEGWQCPANPSEPQLLAKLRCVETNPFSLPDLVSQGKILISGCLRRFIIVSSKPLRGWGERKPEEKHHLEKVWKIVLSAFSPLSLVQEVDCDVSVRESVVTWVSGHVSQWSCGVIWSQRCHRSTSTHSVENGPFGFQHAAVPQCSVTPLPG